ncbi:MAG: CoA transferase, partial [Chloroflexi bacterium]|nr:CoA transferase [Chloroflexota bacterium]
MAGALSGLTVLEIARGMPGALAGMLLGDHGADVVKLELPDGDPYLSEAGARLWNRSKQRIALDLKDAGQRAAVWELARRADVVVVGLRPATAEAWGLTYEELSKDNPGLVFASITGFGWNGPHRDEMAVEGMIHALAGSMQSTQNGGFRPGPIYVAPRIASYGAAQMCVQGVLAALHVRHQTGRGQHVDANLLQGMLAYRGVALVKAELHQDELPSLPVARDPRGARPLFNLVQCGDGLWMGMAAFSRAFCERALEAMGMSHLLEIPRFAGMPNTFPNDEARWELLDILWAEFAKRPRDAWMKLMDAHGAPCEPVLNVDEFRRHPQLWANALALRVDDPVVGTMVQPGVLGDFAVTPGQARPAAAAAQPASAASEVIERWGRTRQAPASAASADPATFVKGPLSGLKVLDFTAFLAGPMCARLITDLGADVTKIEPLEGDGFRIGSKASFMVVNRGKRGVAVDMKDPEVRAIIQRLVRDADVVVYNYRLGVENRLGLDDATLRRLNPNVIVCRLTACGPLGEQAHRPAYDTSLSSLSGVYLEQAGAGNPPAAMGMADISSGIATATAMLLALRSRDETGVGQAVEVPMFETM